MTYKISASYKPNNSFTLGTHVISILSTNPEITGSGELIQDHNGLWIVGYSRSVGWATSALSELWAIKDSLQLAISLGITQLIVELDAN